MSDLSRAKELVRGGACTCALVCGEKTVISQKRGVLPLLELYDSGEDYSAFSAADKVVGRAAAFMYVLLGVSELHAFIISEPALSVLREGGVRVSFSSRVEAIRNRTNTGLCPMETATRDIDNAEEALMAIRCTLEALKA